MFNWNRLMLKAFDSYQGIASAVACALQKFTPSSAGRGLDP